MMKRDNGTVSKDIISAEMCANFFSRVFQLDNYILPNVNEN